MSDEKGTKRGSDVVEVIALTPASRQRLEVLYAQFVGAAELVAEAMGINPQTHALNMAAGGFVPLTQPEQAS